jgi:hypothetical protein
MLPDPPALPRMSRARTLGRNFFAGALPEPAEAEAQGVGWKLQLAVFAVMILLIFSRRPSDLLHAQFYAEDGKLWFSEAYNGHWLRALGVPIAGYLQTFPRLVAESTLVLPFRLVPLAMNLSGAAMQALVVTALLSRRAASWGSLGTRGLLSAFYIAASNAGEVHVILTDAQWHLALLQVIVAFSLPPTTWRGRVMDLLLFGIGALSGPFDVVLFPLLLFFWFFRRAGWRLVQAGILGVGAAVQVFCILHSLREPIGDLGATPVRLLRLLGGDVFLNTLVGQSGIFRYSNAFLLVVLLLSFVLVAAALCVAPLGMRLLAVDSAVLLAGSLRSPMALGAGPLWELMITATGSRYFYFPSIAFLWLVIYCARRATPRVLRRAGSLTLILVSLGSIRRWEYTPWPYDAFPTDLRIFEQARPGDVIRLPLYPEHWDMVLRKH